MSQLPILRQRRVVSRGRSTSRQQRGVVMIVALIVLVALTIASIGLLRSVDTSSTVVGNLGIKKDLYRNSTFGFQQATAVLGGLRDATTNELPLGDNSASQYYATANALAADDRGLPLVLVNAAMPTTPGVATGGVWTGSELAIPIPTNSGTGITSSGGYVFRFVAERLCPSAGIPDETTNQCRMAAGAGAQSGSGSFVLPLKQVGTVYVRVSLRVDGPKNSTSFFQAMLL